MAGRVVVRHKGEGDAFWVLGGLYEVKASSTVVSHAHAC